MSTQGYATGGAAPREFLGAIGRAQSYLNIAYLLLSFPLGIFYFAFLVTGISLGLALLIVWVGLPILVLVLAGARALARGERQLARWLLDAPIGSAEPRSAGIRHPWNAFKALFADGQTWSGLLFLVLKLPLGVISFIATVALLAVSVALILVPLAFLHVPVNVAGWPVTSTDAALLCLAAGMLLGAVSVYTLNGIAALWRGLASALLAPRRDVPAPPLRAGPIVIP